MSKYLPGQSGNPSGRRAGSLNKRTQLAKLFEPYAKSLIDKAVEMALSGDVNALRLCLERLVPKAKDEPTKITLPDFSSFPSKNITTVLLSLLSGHETDMSELRHLIYLLKNILTSQQTEDKSIDEIKRLVELFKRHEREY